MLTLHWTFSCTKRLCMLPQLWDQELSSLTTQYFTTFSHFFNTNGLNMASISVPSILAFVEFCVPQGLCHPTIYNHISPIKSQCIMFRLPSSGFDSPLVSKVVKSIDLNVLRPLTTKSVYTISQLFGQTFIFSSSGSISGSHFSLVFLCFSPH